MSKTEMIRRLRLGDVQKLLRQRYGHTLPDDDAGRDDLRELLLPISLGQEAGRKMENAIQVWAPWMDAAEAGQLMDHINRIPAYLRKATGCELGQRMNLTYQQRQAWGIRTIAPCDMTDEQLIEQRRAKDRARKRRKRREAGGRPRDESFARTRPWEKERVSRATWFRRRETNSSAIKLNKGRTKQSHFDKLRVPEKAAIAKAS
jgi:hypothetical protein